VKQLSAILFSLLLAWAQLLAAPTPPASAKPVHACRHCGGGMSCCSSPSSGSQPMPAVPSNTGPQKQLSISTPAIVTGALPENRTGLICSASRLCWMSNAAPLYARDCARLI